MTDRVAVTVTASLAPEAETVSGDQLRGLETGFRSIGATDAHAVHDERRGRVDVTARIEIQATADVRAEINGLLSRLVQTTAWTLSGVAYYLT